MKRIGIPQRLLRFFLECFAMAAVGAVIGHAFGELARLGLWT